MSQETVEMVWRGGRPPVVEATGEVDDLRAKVIELRGKLAMARAQRDGAQRALDKANRDNDGLRAENRALRAALTRPAAGAPPIDLRRLVDDGVGLYVVD